MAGITEIKLKNINLYERDGASSSPLYLESGIYKLNADSFKLLTEYRECILDIGGPKKKFSWTRRSMPIDPNETKDIEFAMPPYKYILSISEDDSEVMSEVILKEGKIMIYRDKKDIIDYSNNLLIKEEFLENFILSSKPILFHVSSVGEEIFNSIKNMGLFDINEEKPVNSYCFTDAQLKEINKVFPLLFSDSVEEVLKDGSYYPCGAKKAGIKPFSLRMAGSGFQNLLFLYSAWSYYTDRGETLLIKNWDMSLHPLLKNALIELMKKINNRNKGTLFLMKYED